jgi:hypothetical protein
MKTFIILSMVGLLSLNAAACDVCGGGVNNLNPYLFPHLSKSYIGFSYLHNHYRLNEYGSIRNQYNNSLVFTGQYTVKNRLQLMAILPFQFNAITTQNNSSFTKGLGDVTLLANYLALQTKVGQTGHVVSAGAGIKFATGEYNASNPNELNDQNFQLGSGSTDYLLNLVYRFSAGNFSFNTLGAYKYTTPNKDGYRYGDVLTTGATAVYLVRTEGISLAPYVQVINENHYRDAAGHILQDHSGGDVLYAGGGLDVSALKITVGVNYQAAARQNLIQGELQAKPRFSARISFSL